MPDDDPKPLSGEETHALIDAIASGATNLRQPEDLLPSLKLKRSGDLPVNLLASLGEAHVPVKTLLSWGVGTQVVLNRDWQQPVKLMLNGLPVGEGRVVLIGNNFGVEVKRWGR